MVLYERVVRQRTVELGQPLPFHPKFRLVILLCLRQTQSSPQRTTYRHFRTLFSILKRIRSNQLCWTREMHWTATGNKAWITPWNHRLRHRTQTRHQSPETLIFAFWRQFGQQKTQFFFLSVKFLLPFWNKGTKSYQLTRKFFLLHRHFKEISQQ